jgi:phosphoribosylaminoimidazolecarboxamide formyltransferase/IMP cyclohydrolase
MKRVERALLSVSDKTGLAEFAAGLADLGIELLSTGGTAAALRQAGLTVTDVSAVTGFPELLDGRIKTLHPKVHGGLLARRDLDSHLAACREHGIGLIDLVVVNLYPFAATVARPGVSVAEAVEQIDIGGPAMLRSAAKNFAAVTVVCNPERYPQVLAELRQFGGVTLDHTRWELACEVFAHTAAYDTQIAAWLAGAGQAWGRS